MSFRGLTIWTLSQSPTEVMTDLEAQPLPTIRTWRAIPNTFGQFVWQAKPPGKWVVLLRFDEQLITSDADVPLEVDYAGTFDMLSEHRASLLARADPEIGLTAVAVRKRGQPFTPCTPGYFAQTTIDARRLDLEGVEHLSATGYSWPEGLNEPSVIGIQSAHSLGDPVHRRSWIERCPEGLWLLSVNKIEGLQIYEVLS